MSRISRKRYPTSAVSGYSETDLLAFRDTRVILENEGERYKRLSALENPNKSFVEYIHFSTLKSEI